MIPSCREKANQVTNTSNKTGNFMNFILFLVLWQQSLSSDFRNTKQMATSRPPSPSSLRVSPATQRLAVSKAIFTRRLAHVHAVKPLKYTQALARISVQGSAQLQLTSRFHSRTPIQGIKKRKKWRFKATCTVRMQCSPFDDALTLTWSEARAKFKNKNATHLKCTCGWERLKDGDVACVCRLCFNNHVVWFSFWIKLRTYQVYHTWRKVDVLL